MSEIVNRQIRSFGRIDGFDPRGTMHNQGLRRRDKIRDGLNAFGESGGFGGRNESTAACWQSDRRVEVLISTSKKRARAITLAEQVLTPER